MHQSIAMYDAPSDTPMSVRSALLCDELGRISHIFSDKTGTLTQNVMQFRKCSVNGVNYGSGTTEIGRARLRRLGQVPTLPLPRPTPRPTPPQGLDMHHDASEVTLNVCLGREFSGARLQFCGRFGSSDHRVASASHSHSIGCAVLHLGRQRHGADAIATGERLNLIVWARSSAFRGAAAFGWLPPDGYPKDREGDGAIDEVCLSKANDDDYEEKVRVVKQL